MAQDRTFEFQDPDSTYKINQKFDTIVPRGLLAGFEFVPTPDMNLVLDHENTGRIYFNQDLSSTPKLGVVITKQGVEVREDVVPVIPITPTISNTRRDAIVLEHQYLNIQGGQAANYIVLEDVGFGNVFLQNNQTLLGLLTLPSNCTALNQSGVVYTRFEGNLLLYKSDKAVANGLATLNSSAKVPINQINPLTFQAIWPLDVPLAVGASVLSAFNTTTGLGSGDWNNWALCDGQNGRMDLRGRSIIGYNQADSDYDDIAKIGGQKTRSISISNIPEHFHYMVGNTDEDDTALSTTRSIAKSGTPGSNVNFEYELAGSDATATLGRTSNAGGIGAPVPFDLRSPYYVLAYIQRIS